MSSVPVPAKRLEHCHNCGLPLPLREAQPEELAAQWECSFCGSRHQGLIRDDSSLDERRNVRRICRS